MPEKWMQEMDLKKDALRKKLGAEKGKPIPSAKLDSTIASLKKEGEGSKKLSEDKRKTLKQAVLARTFRRVRRARSK